MKKTKQGAVHQPPMEIRFEKPPIYQRVAKAFKLTGLEIFCWGNIIYNPGRGHIAVQLIEHEKVHREQQGKDIEGWWDLYLDSSEFRLSQEMQAHQREYRVYCLMNKRSKDRAKYLDMIAARLASPMYGDIISKQQAMLEIKQRG